VKLKLPAQEVTGVPVMELDPVVVLGLAIDKQAGRVPALMLQV
jgi:hypothetical protein